MTAAAAASWGETRQCGPGKGGTAAATSPPAHQALPITAPQHTLICRPGARRIAPRHPQQINHPRSCLAMRMCSNQPTPSRQLSHDTRTRTCSTARPGCWALAAYLPTASGACGWVQRYSGHTLALFGGVARARPCAGAAGGAYRVHAMLPRPHTNCRAAASGRHDAKCVAQTPPAPACAEGDQLRV